MLKHFFDKAPELKLFRIRGGESFLHHWSHGVLALSMVLLLSSYLRPLEQSQEVLFYFRGFFPLLLTMWVFYRLWREQNVFLLRYGLSDDRVSLFFLSILVLSLLAIFPMRYLAYWLFGHFYALISELLFQSEWALEQRPESIASGSLARLLFVIGLGIASLCLLFYLLYERARQQREALSLSGPELILTAYSALRWLTAACVATASALLALAGLLSGSSVFLFASGIVYIIIWLLVPFQVLQVRRQLREEKEEL